MPFSTFDAAGWSGQHGWHPAGSVVKKNSCLKNSRKI